MCRQKLCKFQFHNRTEPSPESPGPEIAPWGFLVTLGPCPIGSILESGPRPLTRTVLGLVCLVDKLSLGGPGWPGIHRGSLATASRVLGLKVCNTKPSPRAAFNILFYV